MSSVQRLVYNKNNALKDAVVASATVKPISGAILQLPRAREGTASLALSGTYTGSEEANYEFEILSTSSANAVISKPVFTGIGSGDLAGITYAAPLPAQVFTVELNDLGAVLKAAGVELGDVTIVARTPGAVGNTISLKVTRTNLVFTPQNFSLLADLPNGTSEIEGAQYDFNAASLNNDKTIPLTAKRIAFGNDQNNIYLQYKTFSDGKALYHFIPELRQTAAKGSVISYVTQGYIVDVLVGNTVTETYTGIVTLYDFLNAIKAQSLLLAIDGVVAVDRSPTGISSREFPLNTDAYINDNRGEGSEYAKGFTEVSIQPSSPTELVIARCYANSTESATNSGLGREYWKVTGSVSGVLRDRAVSGDVITTADYSFRIPQRVPEGFGAAVKGKFTVTDIRYVSRLATEPAPAPICVVSTTLGINARDQQLTLVYTKKPIDDGCGCIGLPGTSFTKECLGIDITEETGGTMGYNAAALPLVKDLYTWGARTVRDNTEYLYGLPQIEAFVTGSLQKAIGKHNEVLLAVQSNATALAQWQIAVEELKTDVDLHLGIFKQDDTEFKNVQLTSAVVAGDFVQVFEHFGSSGTIGYIANLAGGTVPALLPLATSAVFRSYGFVKVAAASSTVVSVYLSGNNTFVTTLADTTYYLNRNIPGKLTSDKGQAATVAPLDVLKTTTANSIVLRMSSYSSGPAGLRITNVGLEVIAERYSARLAEVYAFAGINPSGKSNASDIESGDGCWQDSEDAFYWDVVGSVGGGYAPAYNNVPYVSSQLQVGGILDGIVSAGSKVYLSTKEFAFQVNVKCPENLREGDTITLSIGNASYAATYQIGDELILELIAAKNLELSGGTDGDNVQTWNVTGSVSGPLSSYQYDLDTPTPYVSTPAGLGFLITTGALAFDKGDKFSFSIESASYRWRKIVGSIIGAWTGALPASVVDVALDFGLLHKFILGSAPSFAIGDTYAFKALQPYAISNCFTPSFEQWNWGNTSNLIQWFDLGSIKLLDTVAIALHTLDPGTVVSIAGNDTEGIGGAVDWNESITVTDSINILYLAASRNSRYIRLTILGQPNRALGWFFVGRYLDFTNSAEVELNMRYQLLKAANDFNPTAYFRGKGVGGNVSWTNGSLSEADLSKLLEFLDYIKINNNQHFCFNPQYTRPESYLTRIDQDNVAIQDVYKFQPNVAVSRRISAVLPLEPVYSR
jgi:hypothetical protein